MLYLCLAIICFVTKSVTAQVNPYADCCDSYCYSEDENPYVYMGSKTAYEFAYGKPSGQHVVPYCRPVQFWSYNRYGARYPSAENIQNMETLTKLKENIIKNYDTRGSYPDSGKLCDKDLEGLRRWRFNLTRFELASELTTQGKDDLRFLARRYQSKYPELLRVPYSNQHFSFKYSEADHTRSSYEAFADGLFGTEAYTSQAQQNNINSGASIKTSDCPAWTNLVQNNENTFTAYEQYIDSDVYKRAIAHVSRRLGFRYTLNQTLILTIYDMCRYEKSWYVNRPSVWCAAFTKDQLKVLEYAEDLKSYYTTGYGSEINQKLGCSTVKDMVERFERLINGSSNYNQLPKAVVQFSNTAAFQQLIVALGIKKEYYPLTATNMFSMQKRNWKTSFITPFGANLVSVLYQCNEGEKYRVMFFLNEKPVEYPGCSVGLCTWSFLKEHLQDTVNSCDSEFCYTGSASSIYVKYMLLILSVALVYYK